MTPEPGSVWSLLVPVMGNGLARAELEVVELHGPVTVLRSLASGKVRTLSTSVLVCGRRGAYLVRRADGSPAERRAANARPPKLHARARRAVALHAQGVSLGAIAERFAVARNTVSAWVNASRKEQAAE